VCTLPKGSPCGHSFQALTQGEEMEEEMQAEQAQQAPEPPAEVEALQPIEEAQPEPPAAEPDAVQVIADVVQEEKKQELTEGQPEKDSHPGQEELHQEMVNRLGMLESKIQDYEQKEKTRQEAVETEKVAARSKLLKELGMIDDLYGRLAPAIEDADPRTEKGQEVYRQWMVKHPQLFKKAPTLEKIQNATEKSERIGNTFRKHLTFSEAIRKIKG
jgi:hypothetical protein